MNAPATFNGYIGSHLAYHLYHEGIFDRMQPSTTSNGLHLPVDALTPYQEKLLEFSVRFGIFSEADSGIELTDLGASLKENVGFFVWMVGGYGEFFRNHAPHRQAAESPALPMVNGREVALGSRQANKAFMWDTILDTISDLEVSKVADLGCGSGGAILDICTNLPSVRGIGIDINEMAIEAGMKNIASSGMRDRIQLYCYNVLDALNGEVKQKVFNDVDTVLSFMMMHDLFNIEAPEIVLRKIAETFPNAKKFLFADTFLSNCGPDRHATQMFSYGFEFVHHFMNIKLFRKSDYETAFSSAGYRIEKTIYLDVPSTYLFVLNRDGE